MTTLAVIFVFHKDEEKAVQSTIDMALAVEKYDIDTFTFVENDNIHLAVTRENELTALNILLKMPVEKFDIKIGSFLDTLKKKIGHFGK
jgi:hypothetical protein